MSAVKVQKKTIQSFIKACRETGVRKLMRCSSGNMSLRLSSEYMLVTASRSWKGEIQPSQISVCRIKDAKPVSGRKPSVETMFHAGILRNRPDVNVVLHFQSPNATALACSGRRINYFVIPEIPFYLGKIARVPFLLPGSPDLANAVISAAKTHNMILLSNHGQVTMAEDFAHVIQNAEFFELACEVIIKNNFKPKAIPAKDSDLLLKLGRQSGERSV